MAGQITSKPGEAQATHPLSFMDRLSDATFLYRPESTISSSAGPRLILIFGWVAARDVHLVKYVRHYQSLYPSSAILLIKARVAVMGLPRLARRDVKPAVMPIREILGPSPAPTDAPQLLIHIFSNGGSCMLSSLYDVYAEGASASKAAFTNTLAERQTDERRGIDDQHKIPQHVTIIDSAPAICWDYHKIVYSVMQGIPAGLFYHIALPIVHLLAMWWWVRLNVLGLPDELAMWAGAHNDKQKVRETRRTYVYSDADKVIDLRGVHSHANQAISRGFSVRKELFVGSAHVAHARSDPERYWRIVQETWDGTA